MALEWNQYPVTNRIYHDPELFALEIERVFRGGWVAVGVTDQLPKNESWLVYEDQGRSILVTRDKRARLHAFHNACRHRGTRLCKSAGSGHLKCSYHGWTYGCDGQLRGAAQRSGLAPFDAKEHGLLPLELETVGSFIFVREPAHASGSSPALREYLADTVSALEVFSGHMHTLIDEQHFEIEADWKFCTSGSMEDYHVPFVHRESLQPYRPSVAENHLYANGHSRATQPIGGRNALKVLTRYLVSGNPDFTQEHYFCYPNLIVIHSVLYFTVSVFTPLGPGRTHRVTRVYDCSRPRTRVNPARLIQLVTRPLGRRITRQAYEEDLSVWHEASLGTRATPDMPRGPAHSMEARVEHMLAENAKRLGFQRYAPAAASSADGDRATKTHLPVVTPAPMVALASGQ